MKPRKPANKPKRPYKSKRTMGLRQSDPQPSGPVHVIMRNGILTGYKAKWARRYVRAVNEQFSKSIPVGFVNSTEAAPDSSWPTDEDYKKSSHRSSAESLVTAGRLPAPGEIPAMPLLPPRTSPNFPPVAKARPQETIAASLVDKGKPAAQAGRPDTIRLAENQ